MSVPDGARFLLPLQTDPIIYVATPSTQAAVRCLSEPSPAGGLTAMIRRVVTLVLSSLIMGLQLTPLVYIGIGALGRFAAAFALISLPLLLACGLFLFYLYLRTGICTSLKRWLRAAGCGSRRLAAVGVFPGDCFRFHVADHGRAYRPFLHAGAGDVLGGSALDGTASQCTGYPRCTAAIHPGGERCRSLRAFAARRFHGIPGHAFPIFVT